MSSKIIDVYQLENSCFLTPIRCANFAEAAAVCFQHCQHSQPVDIKIEGDFQKQLKFSFGKVTQQLLDTRDDLEDAVEEGAYCIAMLVVDELTNLKATKQSQKRTGIDYFLSKRKSNFAFQSHARLEVSGILKGTIGQINQRLKEKVEQSKKSDYMNVPAFIVVVEFSRPLVKIVKR
ncbi:MAG: hypothetical protein AB8G22_12835 [Saprospiraceae bacterium]